jgi:hypothetical protein
VRSLVGMPIWVVLLFVLLTAAGVWSALRGRVPFWLLAVPTVVLAPVGGLLLAFGIVYAWIVGG